MKIALFVEGPSDKETLIILVKKILGEQVSVISRVFRGRGNLLNEQKIHSTITQDLVQEHPDVSKIIICVDSECTPKDETERKIKKVEKSIKAKIQKRYPVYYVGVIHALEGWLLADSHNIRGYLGSGEVNIPSSAPANCKPKEMMKNIFKKAEKEFLPARDCPRMAEKIDVGEMAKQNRSFSLFQKRVKDP